MTGVPVCCTMQDHLHPHPQFAVSDLMIHFYRHLIAIASCSLAISALALPAMAGTLPQDARTSNEKRIVIDVALVSSINNIEVPARVKGFINELLVEEGDTLAAGQVLSKLDTSSIDSEYRASEIKVENATRQAEDDTPIQYAEATLEVAKGDEERYKRLRLTDAVPQQELEQKILARKQAELQVVRAKAQQEIDKGSVDLETQNLRSVEQLRNRHTITAPFDGQVMEIRRRAGEFIQEGETLLRFVDLSKVKVEGSVPASAMNPNELRGLKVVVRLRLADGKEESFDGIVKRIGLQVIADNYIVHAEIENRKQGEEWLLRPNTKVTMDVLLPVLLPE
jgi:multidrug resistance efflux pump